MKLPKEIDSSHLIETIVEIRIETTHDIPQALWAGQMSSALRETGFVYLEMPEINIVSESDTTAKIRIDRPIPDTSILLFANQEKSLRFVLAKNAISFNCVAGKYIGWLEYKAAIHQVLKILEEVRIIIGYDRTMIRYISEYIDTNILDQLIVDISVNSACSETMPLSTQEIQFTSTDKNTSVFVAVSGIKKRALIIGETKNSSLFDVTVYEPLDSEASINEVLASLDAIHLIQKESFFGLLKDDFIKTLSPIY